MKTIFFLSLVIILLSISCKSTKETQAANKTQQQYALTKDTKWVLTSFNGKLPHDAGFKERIPFIVIDKESSRINGHSGCNSFNGQLEIEDSSIKTGMLASTKAFCMGVPEHEFFNYLKDADSYKIEGDKLVLMKGSDVLLVFKKL